ncbi:TPA: baseplate protein, partial [Escherichia coli]|nr:baseplate protein [Escherichia coli]EGJ7889565.1 baseplate protein [Escherichia coli]HAG9575592.1 baseplate protein [Escherichia coli]HAI6968543.1 baseplate protein [Escherichia coli]HAJ8896594.1 baseplate protein [Escherichia coli]
RDIVPSQIISALSVSGVYQVELVTPALRVVAENEWANCTAITLNMSGVSDD